MWAITSSAAYHLRKYTLYDVCSQFILYCILVTCYAVFCIVVDCLSRLQNDLLCVEWDVNLLTLTHLFFMT